MALNLLDLYSLEKVHKPLGYRLGLHHNPILNPNNAYNLVDLYSLLDYTLEHIKPLL